MNPLVGRLFIAFVLFLITFIGYSSQVFIIWPWYGNVLSIELLALLVPFKWAIHFEITRHGSQQRLQCASDYAALGLSPMRSHRSWPSTCIVGSWFRVGTTVDMNISFLKHPDTHSGEDYEVKKFTGAPRYCRTCSKYKPPRAHHCRQCNRYVCLSPRFFDSC